MHDPLPEIEGYRVLRKIGQGGIGVVYLAEPHAEPGRQVALKLLDPRIDVRENDVRRLIREARVGRALHHEHILPVLALEPWRESRVIVMEYVDGRPLAPWRAGEDSPSRLGEHLLVLASIADALHYAHSHGVVHRDVKPGNILVRRDGHPFLIDFGLARTIDIDTTLTASGHILGTPAYLPPEQLAGGRTLDPRGDLYALGVTLFQVATGRLPFRADSLPVLFHQILHDEPPRIPASVPHARALELIARRAMEKSPADRYASAAELRDDLRRAAGGLKPRRGNASLWVKRELRKVARRRLQLAAAAALVLALASAALFLGLRAERAGRQRDERIQQGSALLERGELERALASFAAADEVAAGGYTGRLARAGAFAEFQRWDRARDELREAETLGYRFGGDQSGAEDLFLRGLARFADHRYEESEADLRAAIERDPAQYRPCFVLSRLMVRNTRLDDARKALETCRANLKEINPRHAALSAQIHALAGEFEQAIAVVQRLVGQPDPPRWVHALQGNVYLVAFQNGAKKPDDLRHAIEALERAVEVEPEDGNAWSQLGIAHMLSGEMERAQECAERALVLDPRLEDTIQLAMFLALIRHDWDGAQELLLEFQHETALQEFAARMQALLDYEIGDRDYGKGDFVSARAHLESCVRSMPEHVAAWLTLAASRDALDQHEPALEAFLECRRQMDGWHHPPGAWEPWVRDAEVAIAEHSQDVDIGVFRATALLARPVSSDEIERALAALTRVQDALQGNRTLRPSWALFLAQALATSAVDELRDCAWARELLEGGNLRASFAGDAKRLGEIGEIERACP